MTPFILFLATVVITMLIITPIILIFNPSLIICGLLGFVGSLVVGIFLEPYVEY